MSAFFLYLQTMKIAVASCTKLQQTHPQPVWDEIRNEHPDALVLLGDNIYLDHDHHADPALLRAELDRLYAAQFAEPNFSLLIGELRARQVPIFAIYDDHDFLGNNRYGGDHSPALREEARAAFVHWFQPQRTGADVYSVTSLAGLVDIVVLDERFYRTAPAVSHGDRDGILGAQQWLWLEDVIARSQAPYLLIASSSTIHTWGDESWEEYEGAFNRLQKLVAGRLGTFVISGDVHRNAAYDDSGIVELVTSAVARKGILFGGPRKNYAVLDLDLQRLRVDLRSLKAGWRFKFDMPRTQPWAIP